jgi:hypothetical protein
MGKSCEINEKPTHRKFSSIYLQASLLCQGLCLLEGFPYSGSGLNLPSSSQWVGFWFIIKMGIIVEIYFNVFN